MSSAAPPISGVSLGQGHAQQTRRSSMLLASRKSSSATAASTRTSSSSQSSSTSISSSCPHTHRQNHNSSKLPTFRNADLNNSGCKSSALPHFQQLLAPELPNPAATVPAPSPRQGPRSARGPERHGQGLAPESNAPPAVSDDPHQQQQPHVPINHVATSRARSYPAPPTRQHLQARQSTSGSTPPALSVSASVSSAVAAAPASGPDSSRLPRTRASTYVPSISTPPSTITDNYYAPPPSSTKTPVIKPKPTPTTAAAARRPASLPTSLSASASGAKHVSPARSDRVNYLSATSSSAHSPVSAPPPASEPPTTTIAPRRAAGPNSSLSPNPTTTTAPTRTLASTANPPATSAPARQSTYLRSQKSRRPPLSFSGQPSPGPTSTSSFGTQRRHTFEGAQGHEDSTDNPTKEWASGQRELLLPKSLSSTSSDDKRHSVSSTYRPPPVSYKTPLSLSSAHSPSTTVSSSSTGTTPVRVPPIRGFRSSGSRRSLVIEPGSKPSLRAADGSSDEAGDMVSRDDTLRALEGRSNDYMGQATPLGPSGRGAVDPDDTTDMFLNIAGEETIRASIECPGTAEDQGALSRVVRSSHRRPLSTAIPLYQPTSPPRKNRRLSDQRETSGSQDSDEDNGASRGLHYRGFGRDKAAASAHPGEDLGRRATMSFRSGSTTPRSLPPQDGGDVSAYSRRRTSVSDSLAARTTSYKQSNLAYSQFRTPVYHSSPLAPRAEPQHAPESAHAPEGTESTASTTGPSTVWDELDDLKSRINRLEFTGKLPSTSGAAMSRVSDDRPYTANTTATNVSSSPKRNLGYVANGQPADAGSIILTGQREAHPLLHAALAKSKGLLGSESYRALECLATDSLALLTMMGSAGQPGPVSSAASTIGASGVTDRQLRRKADSVCRSITELCLALNDEYSRPTSSHNPSTVQADNPTTPTLVNGFSSIAAQRRPSVAADSNVLRVNTSPRAMSRLEERRSNMLNGSSMPSPRLTTPALPPPSLPPPSLALPTDALQGRRSSLLISRRRAGTEEPDDGRKSSLLLRTRRAGTEEPEEFSSTNARKPSLLLRPRRGTVGEDGEELHLRAPSRATTEMGHSPRAISRDYSAAGADPASLTSSALPRRRLGVLPTLNSRLAAPSSPALGSARRFADSNSNGADQAAEERLASATRPFLFGQTAMLNRTTSLSRRPPNRESTMMNTQGAPPVGSYR